MCTVCSPDSEGWSRSLYTLCRVILGMSSPVSSDCGVTPPRLPLYFHMHIKLQPHPLININDSTIEQPPGTLSKNLDNVCLPHKWAHPQWRDWTHGQQLKGIRVLWQELQSKMCDLSITFKSCCSVGFGYPHSLENTVHWFFSTATKQARHKPTALLEMSTTSNKKSCTYKGHDWFYWLRTRHITHVWCRHWLRLKSHSLWVVFNK